MLVENLKIIMMTFQQDITNAILIKEFCKIYPRQLVISLVALYGHFQLIN